MPEHFGPNILEFFLDSTFQIMLTYLSFYVTLETFLLLESPKESSHIYFSFIRK